MSVKLRVTDFLLNLLGTEKTPDRNAFWVKFEEQRVFGRQGIALLIFHTNVSLNRRISIHYNSPDKLCSYCPEPRARLVKSAGASRRLASIC